MFGKKVIVTIHGLDWQREKWKSGFGSKFIHQGEKNAVKYADEIIVLSKGVQDYFQKEYGRKTVIIPNGVNRPEVVDDDLITKRFDLHKNEYFLFLGRLVPEKGIRYLVEAFKEVKTDKKLVIAGGASDTDEFTQELKKLAESDRRIIFTGFVQGKTLDELYSNAYVYVLPSDLEGMPLSLLEAMSYGNCCLVSDIAECAEVVEDKAVVFKKSDVEDLREKLQECCFNGKRVEEYKENAADFICRKYVWDRAAEKTVGLYGGKRKNDLRNNGACFAVYGIYFNLQSKANKGYISFFNLTNTTAMRGFWCIIVILVHIPAVYQNRIQDLMGSFAYIGVTFFFMTSAYGLKVGAKRIRIQRRCFGAGVFQNF